MKNTSASLATIVLALVLTGCAGVNFKRPEPSSLTVGKSTSSDVIAQMGTPTATGETTKNAHKIKGMGYSYAEKGITAARTDVITARSMYFSIFNDILVGKQFLSTFKEDITEFDETKTPQIIKGKTTRDDVVKLLGAPSGEAIFPIIKTLGESAINYRYVQGRMPLLFGGMIIYSKTLTVSLDSANVVSDVELTVSGEK